MKSKVLAVLALMTWVPQASAQLQPHAVSPGFDSIDGLSAYPAPGFGGAFRQQFLVDASRLLALRGKAIRGIWMRRDLDERGALTGGQVDWVVRLSAARVSAAQAEPSFAGNRQGAVTQVFSGRVTVPNSPALGGSVQAWDANNAVQVRFATGYPYSGGALCIEIEGRPVAGAEPDFWAIDYERGVHSGASASIGSSCSAFANSSGQTLFANDLRLQIGSSLRISARGRPGSVPLFLLGLNSIPGGVDLTGMGAVNCRQYVQYFAVVPLRYSTPRNVGEPGSLLFDTQIPFDPQLSGTTVFVQTADDESPLPGSSRTNPAGLTTSNGLELRIAQAGPGLGLAIVTSARVSTGAAMPGVGQVDVSMGPILRLLY